MSSSNNVIPEDLIGEGGAMFQGSTTSPADDLVNLQQLGSPTNSGRQGGKHNSSRFKKTPQSTKAGVGLSPVRLRNDLQKTQDGKIAEKVFRLLFEVSNTTSKAAAATNSASLATPQMSELGRLIIPGSQVPIATLYKRTLDDFCAEFEDQAIAELHFNHHSNRRIKNLLRLNAIIKMRNEDGSSISMPSL